MKDEISTPETSKTEALKQRLEGFLSRNGEESDALEEAMQAVMDEYAGGISTHYEFTESSLKTADAKIRELEKRLENLFASDMQELVYIIELQERLTLCRSVIAHLAAKKEEGCYVNSRMEDGEIKIIRRPLAR